MSACSLAELSDHEQELLTRMTQEWQTQLKLGTRRQSINKLVRLGLVEEMKTAARFGTTHAKLYRLKS